MQDYTFSMTTRDRAYNLISQGRVVVKAESLEEARADLLQSLDNHWPDENAFDIEVHPIETRQRKIIIDA